MKIWKWIVGLLAMLGGAAAVASTQNKKKKEHTKKAVNTQKKKVVKAKTQVKNTSNAKKVTGDFKKKYRRKK